MTRILTIVTALSTLGLTTACNGDDPIEAGTGSASAAITDNAHAIDPMSATGAAQGRILMHGDFSGTLSGSALVEVSADGETWVAIGSPASVLVTLQSHQEETTVRSRMSVPVGTYSRVRLTLSGAQAQIDAGGTVGGITLTSAVAITVGGSDGEVVIEKEVEPFTITTNTHARVAFDLNSEGWVTEEAAAEETVGDEEIRTSARADRTVEEES